MKIAAPVHFAMPWRNAGSETVIHLVLKTLVEAGHDVRVYVTDCPGKPAMTFEGVRLEPVRNIAIAVQKIRQFKPDVIMSHHQNAMIAAKVARAMRAKSVYFTHNSFVVNAGPFRHHPDLVIHNSEWVRESLQRYPITGQQVVVHPPLDCARHRVPTTGDAVTLVNVNEHKGGKIFYALAERMRDVRFLAVIGGHGLQIKPSRDLTNVTVVKHAPNLKPVWEQTRLLLMPSIQESYGLAGIEAGCSGIPTLANPTPGLRESLGPAGLFVSWPDENLPKTRPDYWAQREWLAEWSRPSERHVDEWEAAIRSLLDDEQGWEQASHNSGANSTRLCAQSKADLLHIVELVEGLGQTQTPTRPTVLDPEPV
jgi:glycosyltransferase involved in cell wall biosynthesis